VQKDIYQGLSVVDVSDEAVDQLHRDGSYPLDRLDSPGRPWWPNEALVFRGPNGSGLAIARDGQAVLAEDRTAMGIRPKNKEQTLALAMLLDPKIQVVTLTGVAGSGKSLMAIAAALGQSFGAQATYQKIIYVKSTELVGKDLGYLPGSYEDKVEPFMGALHDCLQVVNAGKRDLEKLVGYGDKSKLQKMASQYVRGRTFRKSFVIIDEAQNFTTHELKTMLTRLDEDSKMAILGDVNQADVELREAMAGLVQVIEKFKDEPLFAHLNLIKSERSRLAQIVEEKL